MTKKEFAIITMSLKTYYPRENLLPNDQAAALWYYQLQDLSYATAEAALNKWAATNKWSPTIADLRETAAEIENGQTPDWGEGWQQVCKAIRKFGSYQQAAAMQSLDELTRMTTERLGFMNLCMSESIETDRANFRMIYEQLAKRKKQDDQIPQQLKQIIENLRKPALETKETKVQQIKAPEHKEQKVDPEEVEQRVKKIKESLLAGSST